MKPDYFTDSEFENHNSLLREIERIYAKYVNPGAIDVTARGESGNFHWQTFHVHEGEQWAAFCRITRLHYQDVLRGNRKPRIGSNFFTKIK